MVLASPASHNILFAVLGTRRSQTDIRLWKFVSWRRATPQHIQRVATVLTVLWGLMPHMLLAPNSYLRVLWEISKQFVASPVPTYRSVFLPSPHVTPVYNCGTF